MLFLHSLEARLVFGLLLILHSFRLYLLQKPVHNTRSDYSGYNFSREVRLLPNLKHLGVHKGIRSLTLNPVRIEHTL